MNETDAAPQAATDTPAPSAQLHPAAQEDARRGARLTVHRTSPLDAQQRQVILSLDGQEIATLLYGQRTTRAIAPGRHYLRAYNTLVWKTYHFKAAPGDDIHLTVVNRAAPGMTWMVALFGAGPMTVSIEHGPAGPVSSNEQRPE
jgi:hypothetical protein